jgi:glycosyltransferase involved in cell wall biosynthesis
VDFELIIADDGSTDDTKVIIDGLKDSRIIISHNSNNQGKTKTVNRLFKEAKGVFITIHDADDVSLPRRFEKQLEAFENDSDLILCGTSFYTVDKEGYLLEEIIMPTSYEQILSGISKVSQFHGPTMMIKTSCLSEFSELYRLYFRDNYEDTDLAYRISERGEAINLKDPLYVYRILETSLCRKDVNVRNRNLYKVVAHLANQRKLRGVDDIMENKPEFVDDFFDRITLEYKGDPALIYREAASYYFYWKLYRKALQSAWKGFLVRPFQLINLRTYLYVVRHRIFNFFHFEKNNKKHYKEIVF